MLDVPLGSHLRAHGQEINHYICLCLFERSHDVIRRAWGFLHHFREVLPDAVMGHPALDLDPQFWHLCELDRVVGMRVNGFAQIEPHLAGDDVEGGRKLDIANVVSAEFNVHQAWHEVIWLGVLVILHTLYQ